jgi:predicted amidohydrolase
MPRVVTVAATQFNITGWSIEDNIAKAEKLVRQAAEQDSKHHCKNYL